MGGISYVAHNFNYKLHLSLDRDEVQTSTRHPKLGTILFISSPRASAPGKAQFTEFSWGERAGRARLQTTGRGGA